MKQRYGLATLMVGLMLGFVGSDTSTVSRASNLDSAADYQSFPMFDVLDEIGSRYGYFFTLEEAWKDGELMNRIESQRVQRPSRGRDILQELDALCHQVPHVAYKVDKAKPKIVHIIDGDLAQQKGYAMDGVITSIDFRGTVFHLVAAIAQQGIRVSSRGVFDMHDAPWMDFRTQVHVKGKRLGVRSALSDFIPLEGRTNRILWVAKTNMGPQATTYIRFLLGSSPSKRAAN
jgi:hypothetical protein